MTKSRATTTTQDGQLSPADPSPANSILRVFERDAPCAKVFANPVGAREVLHLTSRSRSAMGARPLRRARASAWITSRCASTSSTSASSLDRLSGPTRPASRAALLANVVEHESHPQRQVEVVVQRPGGDSPPPCARPARRRQRCGLRALHTIGELAQATDLLGGGMEGIRAPGARASGGCALAIKK